MIKKTVLFVMLLSMINLGFSVVEISGCTVINDTFLAGDNEVHLTADIIDSAIISHCIDIQANNIIFDCQGHLIDGIDSYMKYGINILRSTNENSNITIKNCHLNDWHKGIYVERAENIKIYNTNINSSGGSYSRGIELHYTKNNILENVVTKNNVNEGIYLTDCDYSNFKNITAINNRDGITGYNSGSNNFTSLLIQENANLGFHLGDGNINLYNSIIKNNKIDILPSVSFYASQCDTYEVKNVTGTNDKPIIFRKTSSNIQNWDNNFSSIILCNADHSVIKNINYNGNGYGSPIIVVGSDYVNVSDIKIDNVGIGVSINSRDYYFFNRKYNCNKFINRCKYRYLLFNF